jgi:transposase
MSVAVGIDIGAYKHAVAVCRTGAREADRRTIQIAANRGGFRQLTTWMGSLAEPVSLVVMESSGHYWFNLASHLHQAGIPVAVVNPLESKYFGKRRLQRSKSDQADARTLAALGMHDQPRVQIPLAQSELREAARFTMRLVREQAEVCQRIQRLIDFGFPELREAWDDPTCVSALAVLRKAPTAQRVARLRLDTLAAVKRPGDGGRAIGRAKAEQLQALAKDSVATPELEAQVAFEMRLLIQQYDFLERQIDEAEAQLAGLLDSETARRLLTIPGVGPATAATLLAEIGDIWRFTDVDQLLAYAGVHPKELSSGKKGGRPETSWTMAKTGNAYLRAAAYRMAGRRHQAQPGHPRSLRSQARRRQVADERCRSLHEQSAVHCLGCLAQRPGL